MFTPEPKKSTEKELLGELKMAIFGPCVEMAGRKLRLFFTPDTPKTTRLKFQMYSLNLFGKTPPRGGFSLMFTPGQKESNEKVSHVERKIAIFLALAIRNAST